MRKLTILLLFALFAVSFCLYGPDSKVIKLTAANFREKVINSKEVWFVEFFGRLYLILLIFLAPWCGHCQRLAPEWEKLAKALDGIIKVGAVDMEADRVKI